MALGLQHRSATVETIVEHDRSAGRILIVEDETLLRRTLVRMLERRGHRVAPAASVCEARELLRGEPMAAAILDVGLPDGDGLELLQLTKVERSLVVSAEVSDERLMAHGVEHFQRKPLDLASVASQIDALVRPQE